MTLCSAIIWHCKGEKLDKQRIARRTGRQVMSAAILWGALDFIQLNIGNAPQNLLCDALFILVQVKRSVSKRRFRNE
jgi:hypothetical protein